MALVAPAIAPLAKGLAVATSHTAPKATAALQTEAPRSSAGEVSAANLKAETARAIDAAGQSAVAPRLRDQETAERSNRLSAKNDTPTGPRPTFDESLLERRSRTAFDPPEIATQAKSAPARIIPDTNDNSDDTAINLQAPTGIQAQVTTQAEEGFAEALNLSESGTPPTLDVRG
ncbi:MAG: hypothetical protein ACR2O1_09965 [Boseongicola sp.]